MKLYSVCMTMVMILLAACPQKPDDPKEEEKKDAAVGIDQYSEPDATFDAGVPDSWGPDVFVPDNSLPDTYSPDVSLPDSQLPDTLLPDSAAPDLVAPDHAAPDTTLQLVTFVEDLTSDTLVDVAGSSAVLDTGSGVAHGSPTLMESAGDGSEGDLFTQADLEDVAAGEHQFASVTINHVLVIAGNALWRVKGDFYVGSTGRLVVEGTFTLAVEGDVLVEGSVGSVGTLLIQQPGLSTINVSNGVVATSDEDGVTSSVAIETMGSITCDQGTIRPGRSNNEELTGAVTLRAHGAVNMPESCNIGGGGGGDDKSQKTIVQAVGGIVLGPYVDLLGDGIELYSDGDILLSGASLACHGGSDIVIVAQGSLTLENDVEESDWCYLSTTLQDDVVTRPDILLTAAQMNLGGGAEIYSDGHVELSAATSLVLGDADIYAGTSGCEAVGNVTLESGGLVRTSGGTIITAGSSGDPCVPGGNISLRAGAAHIDSGATFNPGTGTVDGTYSAEDNVTGLVINPDAGLTREVVLLSLPLTPTVSPSLLVAARTVWFGGQEGRLEISVDGTEQGFVDVPAAVGVTLSDGFRYRAMITESMFISQVLDQIEIDYQSQ